MIHDMLLSVLISMLMHVLALSAGGVNHVRIPVGYWIMGDIEEDEPWVDGGLKHLESTSHVQCRVMLRG